MSDNYQAVYDAVRSRFGHVNANEIIHEAALECFSMGNLHAIIQQEFVAAAYEMQRPSVLFKPEISLDGNMYCALYGTNLMEGCAGFGETIDAATRNFDENWWKQKAPIQSRKDTGGES